MTGSTADGSHIRIKDKRRKLANRFKDAKDPVRIVIVRDMWLTGFDAPCLQTMCMRHVEHRKRHAEHRRVA